MAPDDSSAPPRSTRSPRARRRLRPTPGVLVHAERVNAAEPFRHLSRVSEKGRKPLRMAAEALLDSASEQYLLHLTAALLSVLAGRFLLDPTPHPLAARSDAEAEASTSL